MEYNQKCLYCNKTFVTKCNTRYCCSVECRNNNYNKIKGKRKLCEYIYNCFICGNKYKPNTINQKYCSKKCKHEAELIRVRKNILNNREQINERWNKWYRKKLKYKSKKKIKCKICNKDFMRIKINQKICNDKNCKLENCRIKGLERYYKNKTKILEKRRNNINWCILNKLRMRISCAVKSQGTYKAEKTINLIGCSIKELKQYLEKQFKLGMTWNNYGRKGWHIDHIIPCCRFNLTNVDEQKKCFHYTNLQPLWERENLMKSSKVIINENK